MSLHSQLLRGLLALPVMLLLAIAGVIAPDPTPPSLPVPEAAAETGAIPGRSPLGACDWPAAATRGATGGDTPIMGGCSTSSSTSPRSRPTPAT